MRKVLFLGILTLVGVIPSVIAQDQKFSFGPIAGNLWQGEIGNGVVDSIAFRVASGRDNLFTFGAFADYKVLPNVSLRAVAQYFDNGGRFVLENYLEDCLLCPVRQAAGSDYQSIKVSVTPKLEFTTGIPWLTPYLVGGGGIMFNIVGPQINSWAQVRDASPQLREVGFMLQNSTPKTALHSVIGVGVDIWNFTIQMHSTNTFGTEYYGPIIYNGQVHRFDSIVGYASLMLGYKFKIKNKDSE